MIRRTVFGLSAAVMLFVTPTASAGYWTGHAEIIRTIIENWILNHTIIAPRVEVPPPVVAPAKHGVSAPLSQRPQSPAPLR